MPSVSCGFDNQPDTLARVGATLDVRIGLDLSYDPNGVNPPDLGVRLFSALIDTGASESGIDAELADDLRLPVVDRQTIAGVHGAASLNLHIAQMHVPELGYAMRGEFIGVHLARAGLPYFAIIGRDILRHLSMTYDGTTGSVTLESP